MSDWGQRAGELAALGTASCWAISALCFESAGRRIGSLAVNFLRLWVAVALLSALSWMLRASALPTDASAQAWLWLGLSGIVGLVLGDMCLFRALLLVGTRLCTLMMSLVPIMIAALGWLILGEGMSWLHLFGMSLTVAGIVLAVTERAPATPKTAARDMRRGVPLALGGAFGQAAGLVLSKLGMGDYHPVAATQIRIIAGALGFTVLVTLVRWWPRIGAALRQPAGLKYTSLGAIFGPFLGVTLSLVAIQRTHAGVAASIMATTPILIIPIAAIWHGDRAGPRGITGAVMAVAGVCLLFL